MIPEARIAVIGAGVSGLIAARRLRDAGASVTLFDKGRRPGGRLNTREHGPHRFDHGAQFFTVRDAALRPLVDEWTSCGLLSEWTGRLVRIEGTEVHPAKSETRYVATPGMVELALHLANGLDVRSGIRIDKTDVGTGGWTLTDSADCTHGPFNRLVVAVPAPQAVPLLTQADDLRERVGRVQMAPCWTVMLAFSGPLNVDFDGAFIGDGPLSWVARDSSKPSRAGVESWVLHASPAWTRAHWDTPRDEVPRLLTSGFTLRFGRIPEPVFSRAHRWGYAQATRPLIGLSFDSSIGVGVCGDWCGDGRVESAIQSGLRVAGQVLHDLNPPIQEAT